VRRCRHQTTFWEDAVFLQHAVDGAPGVAFHGTLGCTTGGPILEEARRHPIAGFEIRDVRADRFDPTRAV